jgi:SMC interacting uncharacterized protein involved in chromosome segregation
VNQVVSGKKQIKAAFTNAERNVNRTIHSQLNREDIFRLAGLESEGRAERLREVKEQVEVLSLKYNFPTKNDVANIAKMLIQIEEKIDSLEEQLKELQKEKGGITSEGRKPRAALRSVKRGNGESLLKLWGGAMGE